MAFGNPYGDLWNVDELIEGIGLLADMDLQAISLADTVGLATPQQIADLLGPVLEKFDGIEIGVHLHSRPDEAAAKVLAAYDAGCRRFDSAIGGLGGCPFAQDVLVGNIPTEKLLEALQEPRRRLAAEEADHGAVSPGGGDRKPVQRAEDVRRAAVQLQFAFRQMALSQLALKLLAFEMKQ